MFVFTTRQDAGAIGQPRGDEITHVREAARQTVGERLLYGAHGVGPGIEAAEPHRWVRRRSPPSSTSPQTQSRPTCGTCTQPWRAQPPLGRAARPGHRPARTVLPADPRTPVGPAWGRSRLEQDGDGVSR
jgi:hypothetical protein